MDKKIISFDLDGTLVDRHFDNAVWFKAVPRLYAESRRIPLAQAERAVRKRYDAVGDARREWYDLDFWLKRFKLRKSKKQIIRELRHLIRFYVDAKPVLRSLKRKGFRLIVVSNSDRAFIEAKLEAGGVKNVFEKVFSATSDFRSHKNEGDFFHKICRECRAEPHRFVHVGDHYEFDYVIPRKCGVKAFLIDRSRKRSGAFVVRNLKEFEERICST